MAGRELEAVARAVARYQAGETVTAAAAAENISTATLQRGLNRRGIAKRGPPTGAAHPAYGTGRPVDREEARAQRRQKRQRQRRESLERIVLAAVADPTRAAALKRATRALAKLPAQP